MLHKKISEIRNVDKLKLAKRGLDGEINEQQVLLDLVNEVEN